MSNLAKEYFNVAESADFCCVSESHFRAKVRELGITSGKLWGRIVYRRSDLLRVIEQEIQWPQSIGEETERRRGTGRRVPPRSSTGPREAGSDVLASGEYLQGTQRSRGARRKSRSSQAVDSPLPSSSGNSEDAT